MSTPSGGYNGLSFPHQFPDLDVGTRMTDHAAMTIMTVLGMTRVLPPNQTRFNVNSIK